MIFIFSFYRPNPTIILYTVLIDTVLIGLIISRFLVGGLVRSGQFLSKRQICFTLRAFTVASILGLALFLGNKKCHAEPRGGIKQLLLKMQEVPKNNSDSSSLLGISPNLMGSFDTGGKGVGVFDGFYVESIRRMQEQATIGGRSYEYDPVRGSIAGRRALLMNSTNTMHSTIMRSDLAGTYRSVLRTFADLRQVTSMSISKNQHGMSLSNQKKGKSILEFGIQPDIGMHLDPYVKAFDAARLRYDTKNQRVLFEIRSSW